MKLSKEYRYHILCEDVQTRTFIESFLHALDISFRRIHSNMAPKGENCGEQYVRKYLYSEAKLIVNCNYQKLTLIVCTDADINEVQQRRKQLLDQLRADSEKDSKGAPIDVEKECIMIWIPKRQIENWIHFLRNEDVTEDIDYRHSGSRPESCKDEAQKIMEYFQNMIAFEKVLPSLSVAKGEYERVCRLQNSR
nr:hypothetical protein [uncultured Butyrivibrio sp.]